MTKIWIMGTNWIGFINCFPQFNKVCLYVDSFSLLGIRWASAYWCFSSFLKVSQPSLLQNYFSPNLSPSLFPVSETTSRYILSSITSVFLLFWVSPFGFVCVILDYFFKVILNLLWILFFSIVVFFRSKIFIWIFYKTAMSIFRSSSSLPSFYNFVFIFSNRRIFVVL